MTSDSKIHTQVAMVDLAQPLRITLYSVSHQAPRLLALLHVVTYSEA